MRIQNWLACLRHTDPVIKLDRIVALLWKTRNNEVFRNENTNPVITLSRAKKPSTEWRMRHNLTHTLHAPNHKFSAANHKKSHWVAWRKPQRGSIKINFDVSKTSQGAVGGFIIRYWSGWFIQIAAFNLGAASILVAKAMAMRNGIKAAIQVRFKSIHI